MVSAESVRAAREQTGETDAAARAYWSDRLFIGRASSGRNHTRHGLVPSGNAMRSRCVAKQNFN